MSKTFQRHFLEEKEAKNIILEFLKKVKIEAEQLFESRRRIETFETEGIKVYLIDKKPVLASSNGILFPTLLFSEVFSFLPKIVVNMGAVSYICNGADVMAPGIVRIEGQFDVDDFVLIIDERHGKPLAIGSALLDSATVKQTKHGKIVKNLHYVGDKLWKSLKDKW